MSRTLPLLVLPLVGSMMLLGCERYCAQPENIADCQPMTMDDMGKPVFDVSPLRLALNKDRTTAVTINAGPSNKNKKVTFEQAGVTPWEAGSLGADGKLTIMAIQGHDFKPGPATVKVEGLPQPAKVRLFLDPGLASMPSTLPFRITTPDTNGTGSGAYPASLGVYQKKIYAINYFNDTGTPVQTLFQYYLNKTSVDPVMTQILAGYSRKRFSDSPVGLAVTPSAVLFAGTGVAGTGFDLRSCSASCVPQATTGITSVRSFSANPVGASTLYAGIFDTNRLGAYSDAALSVSVPFDGTNPNTGMATFTTVGDMDGDEKPDLVVWYQDGGVAVYLAGTAAGKLTYHAAYSMALRTVTAGLPGAVALGDLDSDGLSDVIIATDTTVIPVLNNDNGAFKAAPSIIVPAGEGPITAIAVGDVSAAAQEVNDIVVGSQQKNHIAVLENSAAY